MRRIDSPVTIWPGYILLYDPIPLVKVAVFEQVMTSVTKKNFGKADIQSLFLPALVPCVAEWHLENFPEVVTVENFPGTPRLESSSLINSIVIGITNIYRGESDTSPNE